MGAEAPMAPMLIMPLLPYNLNRRNLHVMIKNEVRYVTVLIKSTTEGSSW